MVHASIGAELDPRTTADLRGVPNASPVRLTLAPGLIPIERHALVICERCQSWRVGRCSRRWGSSRWRGGRTRGAFAFDELLPAAKLHPLARDPTAAGADAVTRLLVGGLAAARDFRTRPLNHCTVGVDDGTDRRNLGISALRRRCDTGRLADPASAALPALIVAAASEAVAHSRACSIGALSHFGTSPIGEFADLGTDSVTSNSGRSGGTVRGGIEAGRLANPFAKALVTFIVRAVSEAAAHPLACSFGALSHFGTDAVGKFADLGADSTTSESGRSGGAVRGCVKAGRLADPLPKALVAFVVGAASEAVAHNCAISVGALGNFAADATRVLADL